jgi:hypothetical protein
MEVLGEGRRTEGAGKGDRKAGAEETGHVTGDFSNYDHISVVFNFLLWLSVFPNNATGQARV